MRLYAFLQISTNVGTRGAARNGERVKLLLNVRKRGYGVSFLGQDSPVFFVAR